MPIAGVSVEDLPDIIVTTRAIHCFRFHHGGAFREADVQLRCMLEDFLVKSSHRISKTGYVSLSRDGYKLVLSPDGGAIVAYSTVHRERTWEQFKAGVRSRFKKWEKV